MCDVIREEEEKKVKKFLKKWQSSTKQSFEKYISFNCQKIKLLRKSTPEKKPLRGSTTLLKERTKDQTRTKAVVAERERTLSSSIEERRARVFRVWEERFQCENLPSLC